MCWIVYSVFRTNKGESGQLLCATGGGRKLQQAPGSAQTLMSSVAEGFDA